VPERRLARIAIVYVAGSFENPNAAPTKHSSRPSERSPTISGEGSVPAAPLGWVCVMEAGKGSCRGGAAACQRTWPEADG
jgi:hypothetical protein